MSLKKIVKEANLKSESMISETQIACPTPYHDTHMMHALITRALAC